jgi:hypothetical protein
MGMYGDKDLALVRPAGLILLNHYFGGCGYHSGTACSSTNFRIFSR